jgi:hypothetical protein
MMSMLEEMRFYILRTKIKLLDYISLDLSFDCSNIVHSKRCFSVNLKHNYLISTCMCQPICNKMYAVG